MVIAETLGVFGLSAAVIAAIMAALIFFLVLFLIIYIYVALALMAIAKKTSTPNSWMAWIPIANFYLITQMAGVSGLWALVLLAWILGPLGSLIVAGFSIWFFWKIAEEIDMPGWTSLLLIIPILNLIILGIYAWKK